MPEHDAGKGDDFRPVNRKKWDKRFQVIDWCKHVYNEETDVCTKCGKAKKETQDERQSKDGEV